MLNPEIADRQRTPSTASPRITAGVFLAVINQPNANNPNDQKHQT